ncbi:Vascular endothelial zinc finger 1 [Coemansia furcata]|uniref:Vascular endothelial zinc finger 1 n=1 Tax=Coemansia furcata TaxID=417177 RepID=A0ACC1KVT8_9FUNG|nr:Vascular endothelial zinc finger 1 [Coemansia furcata]
MLTHTQVRPFQCEAKGCGKRFSRRDNYITHTKKHLLDPECPDTILHRRTCSDLNSGSSTTGSSTPARTESPALPAVSSIFGLLNDSAEEQMFRIETCESWATSSCTGSSSPGKSLTNTPVSAVFLAPVLPPLELLAQASLQSETPSPQLVRRESRPLAVRVSLDDSSNAVASFVEAEQPLVRQLWTPTGDVAASSSVEQFSATVVAGDPAKPFMCSLCGSRFGRVEHVKRHHLVHTGQRKYECRVCFKSFARKDNMVQHLRSHERKDD